MRSLIALACLALVLAACGRSGYDGNRAGKPGVVPQPIDSAPARPAKVEWKYQDNLDKAVRWILDNQKK
jgi:hypothetical protein